MRLESIQNRLRNLIGIDVRSLAIYRVGISLVLLSDILIQISAVSAHYTDSGIVPRSLLRQWLPFRSQFSIHMVSGEAAFQWFLIIAAGVFGVALLLGYKTRLATIASWYLLNSIHIRNPLVLNGGDNLLRILLFWSIFLPLGACWAVDSRNRTRRFSPRIVSAASFGIQLQLCLMYWATALHKQLPVWTEDRSALLIALHFDYLTTAWGQFLADFPDALRYMTTGTLYLELLGPALAWSPWLIGPLRFVVVLVMILFHLIAIAPVFRLGIFPWISAAGWLLFVPTWLWSRLAARDSRLALGTDQAWNTKPMPRQQLALNFAAGSMVLLIIFWNVRTLYPNHSDTLQTRKIDSLVGLIGLHQNWRMFANPPTQDGWYVVPAKLQDGTLWDVWQDQPVDFSRPKVISATLRNSHWIKYLTNLPKIENAHRRPHFTNYLCHAWNSVHRGDRRAREIDLVFMYQSFSRQEGDSPARPMHLGKQFCP